MRRRALGALMYVGIIVLATMIGTAWTSLTNWRAHEGFDSKATKSRNAPDSDKQCVTHPARQSDDVAKLGIILESRMASSSAPAAFGSDQLVPAGREADASAVCPIPAIDEFAKLVEKRNRQDLFLACRIKRQRLAKDAAAARARAKANTAHAKVKANTLADGSDAESPIIAANANANANVSCSLADAFVHTKSKAFQAAK